tara:strand:+ start:647 stop:748 length:102 start_codon:yes stop_codon:yes gene_type:complete
MLSIDYCYMTYIKQLAVLNGFLLFFSGLWKKNS